MKRVIAAIQNVLVSEAILSAFNKRDIYAENSLSSKHQKIASLYKTISADVLVMGVTRFGKGAFDNRMETINATKNQNLSCL